MDENIPKVKKLACIYFTTVDDFIQDKSRSKNREVSLQYKDIEWGNLFARR